MEILETFDQLCSLSLKQEFWVIESGEKMGYNFICVNPMGKGYSVIAFKNYDRSNPVTVSISVFESKRCVVLVGEYDSKQIGEIMITQLQNEIKKIDRIFVQPHS